MILGKEYYLIIISNYYEQIVNYYDKEYYLVIISNYYE